MIPSTTIAMASLDRQSSADLAKVSIEHVQWLQHPTTKLLVHIVNKEYAKLVDYLIANSTNVSVTSEQLRLYTAVLKQTININKTINDTDEFIKQLAVR